MPRRRAGVLLPLEIDILRVGARLRHERSPEFHGFLLASELAKGEAARKLLGHGTIYKALDRLEKGGLLSSRWEVIDESEAGRPRRRLYQLTGTGASALEQLAPAAAPSAARRPRLAGT